jgi:hypothetical protein
MRLLDGDVLTGFLLVVGDEGGVELLVEFARRIIGDVQQGRGRIGGHDRRQRQCETECRAAYRLQSLASIDSLNHLVTLQFG